MTLFAFGKQDRIGLPKMAPTGYVNSETRYTHFALDRFYSSHGFAHPLDITGIPLDLVVDHKLPLMDSPAQPVMYNRSYLLIDHRGNVWKVVVGYEEGKIAYSYFYIDPTTPGWWVALPVEGGFNKDLQMMFGFLYTNPSIKRIEKYYQTQMQSREVMWLSLKEIVKTLNEKFPIAKKVMIEDMF